MQLPGRTEIPNTFIFEFLDHLVDFGVPIGGIVTDDNLIAAPVPLVQAGLQSMAQCKAGVACRYHDGKAASGLPVDCSLYVHAIDLTDIGQVAPHPSKGDVPFLPVCRLDIQVLQVPPQQVSPCQLLHVVAGRQQDIASFSLSRPGQGADNLRDIAAKGLPIMYQLYCRDDGHAVLSRHVVHADRSCLLHVDWAVHFNLGRIGYDGDPTAHPCQGKAQDIDFCLLAFLACAEYEILLLVNGLLQEARVGNFFNPGPGDCRPWLRGDAVPLQDIVGYYFAARQVCIKEVGYILSF